MYKTSCKGPINLLMVILIYTMTHLPIVCIISEHGDHTEHVPERHQEEDQEEEAGQTRHLAFVMLQDSIKNVSHRKGWHPN